MAPTWLERAVTEPRPLDIAHPAAPQTPKAIRTRVVEDLRNRRETRLTGPELTRILGEQLDGKGRGGVSVRDGVATLDLSMDLSEGAAEPKWLNVHAAGSFELRDGWFTGLRLDELDVSGWELAAWTDPGVLVERANAELANIRARDPDLAARLDTIERMAVDGDAVVVKIAPEGLPYIQDAR